MAELEIRCTGCRDGVTSADEWNAWYARADEVEAGYLAEHGTLDGLDASEEWQIVVEERPEAPEEIDCVVCTGTGVVLTDAGREVLRWAEARLIHTAA